MFIINLLCLLAYFCLSSLVLFLLYYFSILKNEYPAVKIRFKFNFLDFYLDFLKMLSYDVKHRDPDTFTLSGIIFYEGFQGSGKTISMTYDVLRIMHMFPKAKLIDNYGLGEVQLSSPDQLLKYENDKFGVISAIDECGIWFNNRDYKHFADTGMLQVIFENRKVRRLLLGTCQKFMLVDKNLRIQTSEIRSAFTIAGVLSGYIRKQPVMDADGTILKYKFKGIRIFIQSHDLRDSYDTFLVIKKFNDKGFRNE